MRPGGFAPAVLGPGPGRPAWPASRSNQGTLASPSTASAHRPQASQAGHPCFHAACIPARVAPLRPESVTEGSALHQVGEEEVEVGGAFGEAAHDVGVPLGAVGEVDAEAVAFGDNLLLEVAADAVEHLELEAVAVAVVAGDQGL